jgi:hypothetical protein
MRDSNLYVKYATGKNWETTHNSDDRALEFSPLAIQLKDVYGEQLQPASEFQLSATSNHLHVYPHVTLHPV